ncbi:hypothetical protein BCR33DRAFT_736119 [Rhizoclosmatium globosum]|uniref:Apple domain-containing protein n=1 Tax=Rhizoclosmatium globosum TaxID=329046 RepID=A0A1Y2CJS8_9FUNG|nr:hypothetical protein BCR33DRAFT_736119 [Rhizoclosmatium globosum]|eukprot:ORY47273.1 hypothetical protein BCR33DRAFT_736119 [Rhizoclosmatium globosum]
MLALISLTLSAALVLSAPAPTTTRTVLSSPTVSNYVAGTLLIHKGGPILPKVQIYPVFVGKVQDQAGWNAVYNTLANSLQMAVLFGQYDTPTQKFSYGKVVKSFPFTGSDKGTSAEDVVKALLNSGAIKPDNNTYIPVHYGPEFNSFVGGCANSCAWHSYVSWNGFRVAIGMIPDCAVNCGIGGVTRMDQLTCPASHEFFEAITDPYPYAADGWRQAKTAKSNWTDSNEIADLCYTCQYMTGPTVSQSNETPFGTIKLAGYDLKGADIGAQNPKSANGCTNLCKSEPLCSSFSYNYDTKTCLLKSASSKAVSSTASAIFVPYGFGIAAGVDLIGNDLSTLPSTDASGCRAQCQVVPACVAAIFNSETKACILKSVIGDPSPVPIATLVIPSQYIRLNGLGSEGKQIRWYWAVSDIDFCQLQCTSDPSCIGMSYDPNLYHGSCFLRSSISSLAISNTDLYVRYGTGTVPGVDYIGNDISSGPATDQEDCRGQCNAVNECVAGIFNVAEKLCILKSALESPTLVDIAVLVVPARER